MSFQPIAIVGQSCVFPGALNPQELWQIILNKKNVITKAAAGSWEADIDSFLAEATNDNLIPSDKCWHSFGGYVRDFDKIFDPSAYDLDKNLIAELDPLFHWTLHAGKEAFAQARTSDNRIGTIIGNLSYPTRSMNKFAQGIWCDSFDLKPVNPLNRFMSGYPAALLAQALNLSGPAYCIDAACASSLYAIKLACDELHRGKVDMMLAGGVNAVDDLLLHLGFSTLGVLSKSGKSRPFHKDADGIITSTGAAFIALKRLQDARADGDKVLALITGIGLSNDGKKGGLLGPSAAGQITAMRAAYESAGVPPNSISLLECHATGTSVGDSVELESLAAVYKGCAEVPIGSVKSNLGHLINAAGMAGVLKVTLAMEAGIRPPTIGADSPLPEINDSPFRLVAEAEPWNVQGPRRAAVSAFGFGGNNAHIILEEYRQQTIRPKPKPQKLSDLAIVGIGLRAANLKSTAAVTIAWLHSVSQLKTNDQGIKEARAETIELDYLQSRVLPNDLAQIHAQQLIVIAATNEAIKSTHSDLDNQRTSVFMGLSANTDAARYFARLQIPQASGVSNLAWQLAAKDAITPQINDVVTLGSMPNVVANRINLQHDFNGPSTSFSAEELSGIEALNAARSALSNHEIDAAIVGAVDLCCEPVQIQAAIACLPKNKQSPGDAAVSLVVKRLVDAQQDGDTIYAVVSNDDNHQCLTVDGDDVASIFGHSHAASGLLQVALAALSIHHHAMPVADEFIPISAYHKNLNLRVIIETFTGCKASVVLQRNKQPAPASLLCGLAPKLCTYAGKSRQEVITKLEHNRHSTLGKSRLAIIADSAEECEHKKSQALKFLYSDLELKGNVLAPGVYFCEKPLPGEIAFTFPSFASAYPGMGQEILLAYPELLAKLHKKVSTADGEIESTATTYIDDSNVDGVSIFSKLKANIFLSLVYTTFSQELLGLEPKAYIGFSAGETAALFTSGVWTDVEQYHHQMIANRVWSRHLAGEFKVLDEAWKDFPEVKKSWATWSVKAPFTMVRKALANEPLAYLATINYKNSFTICGQRDACQRVVALIGKNNCLPLDYNIIHHCPEFGHFKTQWSRLNSREIHRTDVRFYGANNPDAAFYPEQKTISDASLGLALKTVDYPKIIESAYRDGVRIFVEHGASSFCSSYINQILADRAHLAVSLDGPGKNGIQRIFASCAQLYVAGVDINLDALTGGSINTLKTSTRSTINTFPAHEPDIQLSGLYTPIEKVSKPGSEKIDNQVYTMEKAPELPKILPFTHSKPDYRLSKPGSEYDKSTTVRTLRSEVKDAADLRLSFEKIIEVHRSYISQNADSHNKYVEVNRNILKALSTPINAPNQQLSQVAKNILSHFAPAPCATATTPITAARVSSGPSLSSKRPIQRGRLNKTSTVQGLPAKKTTIKKNPQTPATAEMIKAAIPEFDRNELKNHAAGNTRDVFSKFPKQHELYDRQVRMPAEPILLVDRVTNIKADLNSAGLGTISTETAIKNDSWYLHQGHIPPGILIEAGQAYLFLISYLGIDFNHECEFRLLGYDVTYLSNLPQAGDILKFEHRIDDHRIDGDNRIIGFHSDCFVNHQPVLSIRNGRAGFFGQQTLSNSAGATWTPAKTNSEKKSRLAPAMVIGPQTGFSPARLEAFSEGRLETCFGGGFAMANTHTRTPAIPRDEQLLIDEVTEFSAKGGPSKLGYLKAIRKISADDWFFVKYFKEDTCMPNSLMVEMAFQGMAVFMAALGFTLHKDGWTFTPAIDRTIKFSYPGKVTPCVKKLVLEIVVKEVIADDEPTIYADVKILSDGIKTLHAENVGLKLSADYPNALRQSIDDEQRSKWSTDVANVDGIPCDEKQISDCAWGKPSEAFGHRFARFDRGKRMARLPGAPFNFVSRIIKIDGEYCGMREGSELISEWDASDDCIFYHKNGYPTLPFCVLLEAALQPCGWLGSYMGCPLEYDTELHFRNLDGNLQLYQELLPIGASIRFRVRNTGISKSSGMIIISFSVEGFLDQEKILDLTKVSGYFSDVSLAKQLGLPTGDSEKKEMFKKSDYCLELAARPERFFSGTLRLPDPEILMLDRISGYWAAGGAASLGRIRGEKSLDSDAWFFQAHFFQDPVQPGSLGLEAMLQLLQFYMLENDMGKDFTCPHFEPLACNVPINWRYRGQVTPDNKLIQILVDIAEEGSDSRGRYAIGEASLWCDGLKIYDAKNIGMRIVESNKKSTLIDRAQLESHAIGKFTGPVKVNPNIRLPAPPFLFLDRITEIKLATDGGEEAYIKSEWDLKENEWYLQNGRLANGSFLLETIGQASTLFCSILDAGNRNSNRVLRILSLDKTHFRALLPKTGDTLHCKLTLNKKFSYGSMTSYFFRYQCWNSAKALLVEVDNAMTALLPREALLNAKGVSWSPRDDAPKANAILSKPIVSPKSFEFGRDEIHAFATGKGFDCFGPGFEVLKTHQDSPRLSTGKILQIDEVIEFDATGGPWNRGYLKAIKHLDSKEWFFAAHFPNDPCMPAALIGSGCFQCLCFYLAASGFTLDKDGYHFEPATNIECKYQGGGQVTPENSSITYEVFVEEMAADENTFITAYVRVMVDNNLAIFVGHLGIELAPN